MTEVWKDVAGYEGLYQVSNLGKIKSLNYLRKKIEHLLSPGIIKGHLNVSLRKKGKGKSYLLHRLIAQAFIPNPDNKRCINHKDGNKQNNNVSNLEWCTASENTQHSINVLGIKYGSHWKGKFGSDAPNKKQVNQFTLKGKLVKIWGSMIEASQHIGVSYFKIHECCIGHIKQAGGYVRTFKC